MRHRDCESERVSHEPSQRMRIRGIATDSHGRCLVVVGIPDGAP